MDNWGQSTQSGLSGVARRYTQYISMGVAHEAEDPRLPGRVAPNACSEINERGLYSRWQEMMNAESWADIPLDPITANFEGTATFQG